MDINVLTAYTFASGDSIGLTYFIGSTNATGTAPTLSSTFYLSNPQSFAVTGTAVAAVQGTFSDTPAQLAFSTDRESELYLTYNETNEAQPTLVPGANFTCTIFDGKTLVGSASGTVGDGGSQSGLVTSYTECVGVYPNNAGQAHGGYAYVNLPASYNAGDVYTYIISH